MRKHIGLLIMFLISALAIIELRHENRIAFSKLQSLQKERDTLEIEWGKLLLEEGAWSQHRRVASTARHRLDMGLANGDQVILVDLRRGGRQR